MNRIRKDIITGWGDDFSQHKENVNILLAILIHETESDKASRQHEYNTLKELYLAGRYRSAGYNKRDCEDKLHRLNGEIIGIETALSVLYRANDDSGDYGHG